MRLLSDHQGLTFKARFKRKGHISVSAMMVLQYAVCSSLAFSKYNYDKAPTFN